MTIREFIRKFFVNTPYAQFADLSGKHVIVTGASRNSLGFETAKALARWGGVVIVTTRRNTATVVKRLSEQLAAENIHPQIDGHELDLCNAESVNAFTQWYLDHYGERLDILVNNAGVHLDLMSKWKVPRKTEDGYEIQWRTNYLGTAHLTHRLLPLLKQTGDRLGDARVVNVSSQIHRKGSNQALFDEGTGYESWKFYGLSKLAMIHFSHELNRRFAEQHNVQSFCLHPGGASGVYTDVANKGFAGSPVIGFLRKLGAPFEKLFMSTPAEGAQTQIHCATSPMAKGGHYYVHCEIGEASVDSQDQNAACRLWDQTLAWVNGLAGNKQR